MGKAERENGSPLVTVIIPNYNGLHFMEPCMAALAAQTCRDFTVLVVDNASADGSAEWLKEKKIPTIFLEKNLGFSGGVNVGIRAAKTPYVLLLNNDTEPEPGFVEELLKSIQDSEKIFAVSSKMIQLYHKELMDDAGDMYSILGWAFQRGVGRSIHKYDRPCSVFSACAGAAIYRREIFEVIGYFDESHFAYLEDIDVCYRARIFGYVNRYCPTAVVYHVGSGTSGSKYNAFKVRLAARNNVYVNYKNMPMLQRLLNALPIGLGILVKYGFFRRLGFGKEYLDGLSEGYKTRKTCRRVPFRLSHTWNYIAIEGQLLWGTFLYVYEFSARQLGKVSHNLRKS